MTTADTKARARAVFESVADYCRRYAPWFRRSMADLPPASTWDDTNWQRVAAAWGPPANATDVAKKSLWRNRRLAALAAHKRAPLKAST